MKSNITKTSNNLANKTGLAKFELQLYQEKLSTFEKGCTNIVWEIFRDFDKYMAEQQSSREHRSNMLNSKMKVI